MNIFDRNQLASADAGAKSELPAFDLVSSLERQAFIEEVARAELTGKGGACFPSATKMERFSAQPGQKKYLVINGSEHEPGSLKDRYLLETHPRTVLEGALCVGTILGVTEIHFAVNEHAMAAIKSLEQEIARLTCDRPQGSNAAPNIPLRIKRVPDRYIVGEETALLQVLEGEMPLPRRRPPLPIESGLFGCPTLVHNVETVAHVPFILLFGSERYRALGSEGKGVTLCTLGDEFVNSGVHLVSLGIPLRHLIDDIGQGLRSGEQITAVQPGGPSSGFIIRDEFDCLFEKGSLQNAGSSLGCAAVRGYSQSTSMVNAISEIMDFYEQSCCDQCPQCRMETRMLASIMRQVAAHKGSSKLIDQIPKIINANVDKGICGLIKMPVAPALTGLRKFSSEFDRLCQSDN